MHSKLHRVLIACMIIAIGAASAWGQATTSIRGAIADPTGASVPGVVVTLENIGTNASRSTISDETGAYQILQIAPGAYRIRAELPGFRTVTVENLQLLVNTPVTLNLKFESVSQVSTSVEVSAQVAPLINTADATLGNAFVEQQVKELPIESRNVGMLLSLQPGVTYVSNRNDGDTRSGTVNGARSDQSTIKMDGVDVTDQASPTGQAFMPVLRTTPDSLQEFRVTTISPTATEGSSSGAQVSLITKGGTNQFHGSLYEYMRNTATSANDYFIKLAQLKAGKPNEPPTLNRNVYGGSFGGPIKKDRLFLFANYEGRKDREQQSIVRTVATESYRAGNIVYANEQGGRSTITPTDLKAWDPMGVGVNPAVLAMYRGQPLPNDLSVGDGLNTSGFRFAAPTGKDWNVYIGRVDYRLDANGSHTLFWRGSAQRDLENSAPYLPGQTPQNVKADRSRGFAFGYTAVLTQNFINEVRWGFTRRSFGEIGNSDQPFITLANSVGLGLTRTTTQKQPVNNITDNVSWTKGRHTLQFGGGLLYIRDERSTNANSFSTMGIGVTAIAGGGVARTGLALDPGVHAGFANVARTGTTSYDAAVLSLMGIITSASARYNYNKDGSVLAQGAPILRRYAINKLDGYIQDSFRLKPNLIVNAGLRYQIETPPWETNGMQVAPNVNLAEWYQARYARMLQGIPSNQDPVISYVLSGKVNEGESFYEPNKNNFSPRLSLAYSPMGGSSWLGRLVGDRKTSIRAGAAVMFDHLGTQLISNFAGSNASYGLATSLGVPLGTEGVECAPRIQDFFILPTYGCAGRNDGYLLRPAPAGGFPATPPVGAANGGYTSITALDRNIRTPYAYTLNLSVARDLGADFSVEVSYVGRLAHNLLTRRNFAQPMSIRDPQSGTFGDPALARLSELARQNLPYTQVTDGLVGTTAAFWNNLFQPLATANVATGVGSGNCSVPGTCTPVQAAYLVNKRYLYDDTFMTWFMDVPGQVCASACSSLGPYVFYSPQFYSMTAHQSFGTSNYHAMQVSLRKRFSKSVQFDANYVWSKSFDLSSSNASGAQSVYAWDYKGNKGISDFDMTHQFNSNWVVELPFGRGQAFAANAPGWLNAVAGGWQVSGLFRLTSGLPFSVQNGQKIPTLGNNYAQQVAPVTPKTTRSADGRVFMFEDPAAAFKAWDFSYAGKVGSRNTVRGDGYLSLDSSLSKRWTMPYAEGHSVQFRWEVFNVGNFTRFDPTGGGVLTNATNFGTYTQLLTSPRIMQFALRYEF